MIEDGHFNLLGFLSVLWISTHTSPLGQVCSVGKATSYPNQTIIYSLYCHFWKFSWDIWRLQWQPLSSAWTYVSAHYDTGRTRTPHPVHQTSTQTCYALRHIVTCLNVEYAYTIAIFPTLQVHRLPVLLSLKKVYYSLLKAIVWSPHSWFCVLLFRFLCYWCCWVEDATILFVWWHCQHSLQNGIYRTTWVQIMSTANEHN